MGHKYIKEEDTFSTNQNGTVPKPTAQEVSDRKVLGADGTWVANSGGGSSSLAGLDDVSLTAPSNGQILKYNGTSTKWENANETVSSRHTYSTTEQVYGTWVDGKPVYEVAIPFDNTASTDARVDATLYKIKHLIEGFIICFGSGYDVGNYYNASYDFINMYYEIGTKLLHIRRGSNGAVGTGYIIIRYTKTTD